MAQDDLSILLWIGGFFILLGLVAIIWDRIEKKKYYDSLSTRPDAREFMEGWPVRPQFGAIKIGGWIAITIGVLMWVMVGAFWLFG